MAVHIVATLYIFPDTNVFIHSKPLADVDWAVFGAWDRIEVLLTRPVQKEIDDLKGRGNSRRASRARSVSSTIRNLLKASDGKQQLRERPDVLLCLRHDLRREEPVPDGLDYSERDDQLVGIALAFQRANPRAAVKLLTHDTGPMASAKAGGLDFVETPESWLLAPEKDEAEKREKELRAELARYRNSEPIFALNPLPDGVATLESSVIAYRPLSSQEVKSLVANLKGRFPLASDFGALEAKVGKKRDSDLFGVLRPFDVFEPASTKEIDDYRNGYVEWESQCTEILSKLHSALHRCIDWPCLTVRITNVGSRPATDALVVVQTEGKLALRPLSNRKDGEQLDRGRPRLPAPPTVPRGRWKRVTPFEEVSRFLDFSRIAGLGDINERLPVSSLVRRDPNGLYFKQGGPGRLGQHIEYECAQWRHQQPAEFIEVEVVCAVEPGPYAGCIRMEVHAANITIPVVTEVPVRIVVGESTCFEIAQEMVEACGA